MLYSGQAFCTEGLWDFSGIVELYVDGSTILTLLNRITCNSVRM